jgi:hypothetical protein
LERSWYSFDANQRVALSVVGVGSNSSEHHSQGLRLRITIAVSDRNCLITDIPCEHYLD